MRKLFNIVNDGVFTDDITFSRPMATNNSTIDIGTGKIPVEVVMPSSIVDTELSPIKGIFLHIGAVDRNAAGTFDIILKSSVSTHTFTYYVSALYNESTTGQDFPVSQYWQGFDLLNIDMSGVSEFELTFSCTSHKELELIGNRITNTVNRYFITTETQFLSATASPEIRIGSYLRPLRVTGPTGVTEMDGTLPSTTIVCDINFIQTRNIIVWNNSTLHLSSGSNIFNESIDVTGILATPGSTILASPRSSITLDGAGSLVGLNNSTISLSGTDKLPYTFLTTDSIANTVTFNVVDNVNSWQLQDRVILTGGFVIPINIESRQITAVNTNEISVNTGINTHLSISTPFFSAYGPFIGAPLINLSRDMKVYGNIPSWSSRSRVGIKAEEGCKLSLKNIEISGIGVFGITTLKGAISLYNTDTVISNCSIYDNEFVAGIYIDTSKANNFVINNNNIFNNRVGIIQENRPKIVNPLIVSHIHNNAIVDSLIGAFSNYTDNITYCNNIISHCTHHGLLFNHKGNDRGIITQNTNTLCTTLSTHNNVVCFTRDHGVIIGDVTGQPIVNTNVHFNGAGADGLICNPLTFSVAVSGLSSSHNKNGAVFNGISTGSEMSAFNIDCRTNSNVGIVLNSMHGDLSGVKVENNAQESVTVTNCNNGVLNIHNLSANDNGKSIAYSYPNADGFNFFPTYLINSHVLSGTLDSTCITLSNTKCEKFVVEGTTFNSTGPNVTLLPSTNSLIEGSYIFSNCTFSSIPFDNLITKYQTDILSETGFSIMYLHGDPTSHAKHTPAGIIQTDTTVFKNNNFKVSEKLTPHSSELSLKSSKKIIFVDNFDNNSPPSLSPEYLIASVWVKKDSLWPIDSTPHFVVASNPTLKINENTIIDSHSLNTTDWVQLTSIVPLASAIDSRGPVELYVECSGTSGGSINVDQWEYTIFRGN